MAKLSAWRWGDWIAARAKTLKFKRHKDLADSIGCSREQLTRWLRMEAPPEFMRKGFDRSLAHALQTDRRTLFQDYVRLGPSDAKFLPVSDDHIFPEPLAIGYTRLPKQMLAEVAEMLKPGEIEKVLEYAAVLIQSARDERQFEIDSYLGENTIKRIRSMEALTEFAKKQGGRI